MAFSFNHQGQMIMRQLLKFSETDQQNPLVHFLRFTVDPYQNSRSLLKQESNFHSKQKGSFQASLLLSFRKLEKLHYLMLPQHSRNQYYSYLAIPLDDYLNTPITKSTFLYAYEHLQHFLLHLEPKCL